MQTPSTNKGYDYTSTAKRPDPHRPNGWLNWNGKEIALWVSDVATGFSLNGSTAQSRRTRTFFASNFTQISLDITVQLPSQKHLGDLAEFVRETHLGMDSNTKLEVIAKWPKGSAGNQRLKGPHENISAEGYVKTITREHMKQVWSPELTFQFVVEKMISPKRWADSPVTIRRLKSWNEIIDNIMKGTNGDAFIDDPSANTTQPLDRPPVTGGIGTGNRPT